jgi:hypothetical protein
VSGTSPCALFPRALWRALCWSARAFRHRGSCALCEPPCPLTGTIVCMQYMYVWLRAPGSWGGAVLLRYAGTVTLWHCARAVLVCARFPPPSVCALCGPPCPLTGTTVCMQYMYVWLRAPGSWGGAVLLRYAGTVTLWHCARAVFVCARFPSPSVCALCEPPCPLTGTTSLCTKLSC